MDIASYAHTLSPKDQKWLSSFTEEYVNANFNHGGKKIHKTKKLKKAVYDRNNARNRDIYTKSKAQGALVPIDAVYSGIKQTDEDESVAVKEKKLK